MSDLKSAIRNLVRQEYQKTTTGVSNANRLGVVSLVNSDGTAAIMVDGQLVTATTLYPCVPGQQVIVMPAGGIYKAAPISPNAPAVEIIHPPFFSGEANPIIRVLGLAPNNPPPGTGYADIFIQQFGDAKLYRGDTSTPELFNFLQPVAMSPTGRYAVGGLQQDFGPPTTYVFVTIDLGTSPFSSSNLIDAGTKTYDITSFLISKIVTPACTFTTIYPSGIATLQDIAIDDNGVAYFNVSEGGFSSIYSIPIGASAPTLLASVDISVRDYATGPIWDGANSTTMIGSALTGPLLWHLWDLLSDSFTYTDNVLTGASLLSIAPLQNKSIRCMSYNGVVIGPVLSSSILSAPLGGGALSLSHIGNLAPWALTGVGDLTTNNFVGHPNFAPIQIGKSKHFCLQADATVDSRPRLFPLTGSLGGTFSKGTDPIKGFSPNTPTVPIDDAVIRVIDPNDIACMGFTWNCQEP